MPMTPGVAMAENLKRVIERAKKAGMQAEDTFSIFGEEITLADAIQRAGLDLNEFFDSGYKDTGDEVVEFVRSMFDENGNTPKGPTGVLISVEKKFGEEAIEKAKHIMNELMTQAEMKRIQELSGLPSAGDIAHGLGQGIGTVKRKIGDVGDKIKQGVDSIGSEFSKGYNQGLVGNQKPQPIPANQTAQPNINGAPSNMPPPGQAAQPASSGQAAQPATGATAPGGRGPKPSQMMPKPQREELDAMLRIAGLLEQSAQSKLPSVKDLTKDARASNDDLQNVKPETYPQAYKPEPVKSSNVKPEFDVLDKGVDITKLPARQSKMINTKDDFEESILNNLKRLSGIK
jgi:hypothetical protein